VSTLFEKIGGTDAVNAAVDRFYERVLADDRIKHFFKDVDIDRQAKHQIQFLTFAFGGTPEYAGRPLRIAHKRLVEDMGLGDEHFDAVAENLQDTLKELGVSADLIVEVIAIVESTRDDVLNKNA